MQVPADQATWIVMVGEFSAHFQKAKNLVVEMDQAVAEIEATGWRLDQIVPGTRGVTSSSVGGSLDTAMVAVFRRA